MMESETLLLSLLTVKVKTAPYAVGEWGSLQTELASCSRFTDGE